MELSLTNLRDGYVALAQQLVTSGDPVTARGLDTLELRGVTLRMRSFSCMLPVDVNRRVNLKLAAVEALSLVAGVSRPDLLRAASPRYGDVMQDDTDYSLDYGAYGPRTADQVLQVVDVLKADPFSRQAVVRIWRAEDLTHDGDKPCTLELVFQVRGGTLVMHTHMRSQDFWLGLPYDLFMFTQLQHSLAHALGVMSGEVIHHVASMHVYARNLDDVRQLAYTDARRVRRLDHPLGVNVHPGELFTDVNDFLPFQRVARRLLDDEATRADRHLNPWFTRQIDKLQLTEVSGADSTD